MYGNPLYVKLIHLVWIIFCHSLKVWAHSKTSQKVRKKCSTGQMFICIEVTSYKIYILAAQSLTIGEKEWRETIHIFVTVCPTEGCLTIPRLRTVFFVQEKKWGQNLKHSLTSTTSKTTLPNLKLASNKCISHND